MMSLCSTQAHCPSEGRDHCPFRDFAPPDVPTTLTGLTPRWISILERLESPVPRGGTPGRSFRGLVTMHASGGGRKYERSGKRQDSTALDGPQITSDWLDTTRLPSEVFVEQLGMEPISSIYAPPWADPLPVSIVTPSKSNVVAVLSQYLSDPTYAKATWYSDGSLLAGVAGGAAVRVANGRLADDAAKAATRLPLPQSIPVSLTSRKRAIDCLILERWAVLWRHSTTIQGLCDIHDSPPTLILRTPYLSTVSRADISILSQLWTDFSSLNAHRFRCRLTPSPACDAAKETRAHFLLHCPAWECFRRPLQLASYAAGILGTVDARTLLNYPKLLEPVIEFSSQTGRFR
ncbi:hypothetical protein DFH08DRAFT_939562 [Mycena albidolilacea]|uniref:Reverse transcriptase zinc-binding domain-containing protein n=1 Tax=Mycena albidolilacea TaxID=1033008 RepID=A0AAD7ELB0_9AGAR|nr:hypothetical protein DFH08DRAFT_939562 [Mycena albidolilacea]